MPGFWGAEDCVFTCIRSARKVDATPCLSRCRLVYLTIATVTCRSGQRNELPALTSQAPIPTSVLWIFTELDSPSFSISVNTAQQQQKTMGLDLL